MVGVLMLPKPYDFLLWILYGIALPLSIRRCNRHQLRIRTEAAALQTSGSVNSRRGT
jgi:hypothetical protein